MDMTTIDVTKGRKELAETVNRVAYRADRVLIRKHGKPVAIRPDSFDRLPHVPNLAYFLPRAAGGGKTMGPIEGVRGALIGMLFLATLVPLHPTPALAETKPSMTGNVVHVVDGDSIMVRIGSRTETVRYIGVNTPDFNHPTRGEESGAREAFAFNRSLVGGHTVRLELDVEKRDRYERLLAYVFVGETMVNAELVAQGYAQVMTIPPNVKYQQTFLGLQRQARLLKRGLWKRDLAPPGPRAPTPADSSASSAARRPGRPGIPPLDGRTCPLTHPIKGNFKTFAGEPCIAHVPGGQFYGRTKPERCYASHEEASQDGCRPSRR